MEQASQALLDNIKGTFGVDGATAHRLWAFATLVATLEEQPGRTSEILLALNRANKRGEIPLDVLERLAVLGIVLRGVA